MDMTEDQQKAVSALHDEARDRLVALIESATALPVRSLERFVTVETTPFGSRTAVTLRRKDGYSARAEHEIPEMAEAWAWEMLSREPWHSGSPSQLGSFLKPPASRQ